MIFVRPRSTIIEVEGGRVSQLTRVAELLGLSGVEVDLVERESDGSWTAHVTSAGGRRACCPGCGQASKRAKEVVTQTVKHLVLAPMRVVWHKGRFWCDNLACEAASFAESGPVAAVGGRVSESAKTVAGHLVGDWLAPVSRVAAGTGLSWQTVHHSFVGVAAEAGIHVEDSSVPPQPDTPPDPQPQPQPESRPGLQSRPNRVAAGDGVSPSVEALGIDEHRRGRPLFHRDPVSGAWVADADRWQTVFVDSAGGHGLLGQVEGRAKADAVGWLAAQDPAWRAAVRHVTIDMSTVFKSAALAGLLPNARVVVDPFHVAQLANKMVDDVRRRLTYERYGRRGRASDPEYALKNPLRRGKEKLSTAARHKLLCALADLGEAGRQLGAAWRAKELLRDLLKLSPNRTGIAATRDKVAGALEAFFDFAGAVGATLPEIQTLAETVSAWRAEIARAVLTGHSNAAAEGVNRLVKLVYRTAFGLTNVGNQQRRARYAASRSTRPDWLPTVTAPAPQTVAA
jgi:transposase